MTIHEFIGEIEDYYGNELNGSQKSYVEKYLSVYEPSKLVKLLSIVMTYHPISFGTPGIAVIEKAHVKFNLGDPKNGIDGHSSLKTKRTVSATAPHVDPVLSEEEKKEVAEMLESSGGLLGLIGKAL